MSLNSPKEILPKNTWWRLGLALGIALIVGCVLVPPIVTFMRAFQLGDYTVGKIARRIYMIVLVLGLLSQLKNLALPGFREVGFAMHPGAWRNVFVGALVGFVSLLLVSLGQLYTGYRYFSFDNGVWDWLGMIGTALVSAPIIAVLEEYLFRGLILHALRRRYSIWIAVTASSALFGSLHFFQGGAVKYDPEVVRWYEGFVALGYLLQGMVDEINGVAFTGIFMVGTVLCVATVRTGSLFLAAGIHFGWVFYIKTVGEAFERVGESNVWFGGSQIYDGLVGPLGLMLLIPFLLVLIKRRILRVNPRLVMAVDGHTAAL